MSDYNVKLSWEQVDKISFDNLKETRETFVRDLNTPNANIFFFDDDEKDKPEIQKYIDALDLLIDWYNPNPYE
jgi:hypothetical protein